MKKFLLTFILFATVYIAKAQMTVTISGNNVTFSYMLNSGIWNSAPVNLYAWVNGANASNATYKELLGGWPGTQMVGSGSGPYTTTVNLANFYPTGTIINDISFIYNYNGNQTGDKLTSVDATGWNAVTITSTLAVSDVNKLNGKSSVIGGKLYTSQKGNLAVSVYDFGGKFVKSILVNSNGNPIDLNVEKGMYLLKVSNGKENEIVKFAK